MGVRLTIRTGVNTGEVVTGDVATRQTFATGPPTNALTITDASHHLAGEILLSSEKVGVESSAA
jgi:hypothetical protein